MCVIIIKDNNKTIDHATLVASSIINPDGLGILWLDTYEVEKIPSEHYNVLSTKRPFIAHFRYATVGKVNLKNCHPFNINEDNILFQNGTVRGLGNSVKTDTQHLAEILKTCSSKNWRGVLEMTDCRYVVANVKKKKYSLFNKKLWHTDEDGILYSKNNVLGLQFMAVYGTLKYRGSNYYSYLTSSEMVSSGYTKDKYPLIVDGLPYLLSKKGVGHNVDVDVFLVDKETMEDVDILESHPQWYKREKIDIELTNGDVVSAWTYFNDTIKDTGVHVQSYAIAEPDRYSYSTGYSWYDTYDISDYDTISEQKTGVIQTSERCHDCETNLWYDEYEMTHYCSECDDYVHVPNSKGRDSFEEDAFNVLKDAFKK